MTRKIALCVVALLLAAPSCKESTVQGPEAKKLTLVKPSNVSVARGDTDKVALTVKRENFTGPVTVQFSKLPTGVSVEDDGGKIEGTERTFVLKATDTAALVSNHVATVSVSGPDGMKVSEEFEITIKEKKS
jgi:hypothetical protein